MFGPFRRFAVALALPWLSVVAIAQSASPPESDDGRQWLNPRSPASSPLAAASRANALNQNDAAEKLLRQIIRRSPRTPEASEAHKLLSRIYIRTGRYKRAADNLDEWRRKFPTSADAEAERQDVDQFRGLPDQINGPRRPAVLKHEGDFSAPLTVNGKECTFLMDTGAWVSIITQLAAERLGLEFHGGGAVIGDSSGKGFAARTAVAKELVLGNMRFKNVSFMVVPDQEPFTSFPVDQRGILGVPIHFAVGTWQWSKSGTIRLGEKIPPGGSQPNLIFFRNKTLVSAEIAGRSVFFTLDSGAVNTDLNSNFVGSFGDLVANAQKTTREVTGIGGTSTFEAYILSELKLSVAGHLLTLRPAEVTVQGLGAIGGECCVGNFGDDLLTQAEGFSLDFDNMSLRFQ
jgi:predicted aspartyl protease